MAGEAVRRRAGVGSRGGLLLVLLLLLVQPAAALSYPVTIPYGRSWPISVVADSARGLVYVDATSGEYPPTGFSFGVINATDHEVTKVLGLNVVPGPMALDQGSGDVYVAGSDSIEVFDGGNQSFVRGLALGSQIIGMAHDGAVSRNIFVTAGDQVLAVDPQTGGVVANATLTGGPNGIALDPTNGRLYVSEYLSAEIAVYQASTLARVGTVQLPSCCASQLALNPRTQMLYASTGTNYVDIVNAGTGSFDMAVKVAPSEGNSTGAIAVDNATGRVYVASSPGGSIIELDGSSGTVLRRLQAQNQVAGLALDTGRGELYATNYHQITVFDAKRPGTFLYALVLAGCVVAVAAVAVYLIMRRRDERARAEVRERWKADGRDSRDRGA